MGTWHEDQYTFWSYLAQFFLEWKMFQTKVIEKIKTHIVYSIYIYIYFNCTFYEIMLKNIVESDRPQMTICCMCIARWITNTTNTHSYYVILIAFPLKQWLHEHALWLHYTYTACLVLYNLHKFFGWILNTHYTQQFWSCIDVIWISVHIQFIFRPVKDSEANGAICVEIWYV